jgi:hypothetical protein
MLHLACKKNVLTTNTLAYSVTVSWTNKRIINRKVGDHVLKLLMAQRNKLECLSGKFYQASLIF